MPDSSVSRRDFLANSARGLVAATLASEILPAAAHAAGAEKEEPIKLEGPLYAKSEQQSGPLPQPLPPGERVGFAVVGLGHLALEEIIPAFAESKKARLAAVVSGDRAKGMQVAREHGLPESSVYDYKTYDTIRDDKNVDIIYIVLPNGMHAEYTVRGAQAGKHILCEKPMANSVAECEQMIAACKQANKKLMVAYRIQYEPNNRLMQKWVRDKKYGAVKLIEGANGQAQGDPNQWREKKALAGGGALPDVGLYCLNTFRWLLGEEPEEVFAMSHSTPGDPRFKEVEESMIFQLRFPGGVLANAATSYGTHQTRRYRVNAEDGWFGLDPAFAYKNLKAEVARAEDKIEYLEHPSLMPKDQFALELDHMAECVMENKGPYTPGEEGLQDQRIMEALYASAATGRPVKLTTPGAGAGKLDLFRGEPPKSES